MAKQSDLFGRPAHKPRRIMMHIHDAGADAVQFHCGRCGHTTRWLERDGRSIGQLKRGSPCPQCNPPPFDESYVHDMLKTARARAPMNREEFALFCALDAAAGYHAEVNEATRRYFETDP